MFVLNIKNNTLWHKDLGKIFCQINYFYLKKLASSIFLKTILIFTIGLHL